MERYYKFGELADLSEDELADMDDDEREEYTSELRKRNYYTEWFEYIEGWYD